MRLKGMEGDKFVHPLPPPMDQCHRKNEKYLKYFKGKTLLTDLAIIVGKKLGR